MNCVTITVKKTGSDNLAKVQGWPIRASCTCSPEDAVRKAAQKVADRLGVDRVRIDLKRLTEGQCSEIWTATFTRNEEPQHARD